MADVKDRAKDAVDEGAAKAKETTDTLAEKAGEVMSDVRGYAEHVIEQSQQGYRQVADQTQEGIRLAGAVVRENPGLSVSAAFCIGVAAGVVIGISLRPSRRNDFSSHFHRPRWLS